MEEGTESGYTPRDTSPVGLSFLPAQKNVVRQRKEEAANLSLSRDRSEMDGGAGLPEEETVYFQRSRETANLVQLPTTLLVPPTDITMEGLMQMAALH